MVNDSATTLDSVFGALADQTRRAILARLMEGRASVTELARPFKISLPAVSKHLRVLERAGLLTREKQGRVHTLGLNPAPLRDAAEWLDLYAPFWEEQFDALASFLAATEEKEEPS